MTKIYYDLTECIHNDGGDCCKIDIGISAMGVCVNGELTRIRRSEGGENIASPPRMNDCPFCRRGSTGCTQQHCEDR